MTIVEFLLARIADDERRAPRERADYYGRPCPACGEPTVGVRTPLDDEAIRALHTGDRHFGCPLSHKQFTQLMPDLGPTANGARVLAECEAKRKIIELADEATSDRGLVISEFSTSDAEDEKLWADDPGDRICRTLAAIYADHPDFNPDWRPSS